jgi:hypothetical protein
MARNRKNETAGVRFGPAIKAFLLCLFIAGSGIGYVWQQNQIYSLGKEIKSRELRLAELKRLNKLRGDQLSQMRSVRVLDARVKELRLGLVPPLPEQVVRMVEFPMESGQVSADRRFAGDVRGGVNIP